MKKLIFLAVILTAIFSAELKAQPYFQDFSKESHNYENTKLEVVRYIFQADSLESALDVIVNIKLTRQDSVGTFTIQVVNAGIYDYSIGFATEIRPNEVEVAYDFGFLDAEGLGMMADHLSKYFTPEQQTLFVMYLNSLGDETKKIRAIKNRK